LLVRGQAPESRVLQLAAQLPLQLGDPVLHVALQLVQPLPEPDDLLDPRQVHAQLLRQAPYLPQLLDVALRVEPGLAAAAAGFDEALALVEAQRLRVHIDQLGRHAYHVERLVLIDLPILVALLLGLARIVATVLQPVPPEASLRNQARPERRMPSTKLTCTVRRRSPPPRPPPATTRLWPSEVPGGTGTLTPS